MANGRLALVAAGLARERRVQIGRVPVEVPDAVRGSVAGVRAAFQYAEVRTIGSILRCVGRTAAYRIARVCAADAGASCIPANLSR